MIAARELEQVAAPRPPSHNTTPNTTPGAEQNHLGHDRTRHRLGVDTQPAKVVLFKDNSNTSPQQIEDDHHEPREDQPQH